MEDQTMLALSPSSVSVSCFHSVLSPLKEKATAVFYSTNLELIIIEISRILDF